MITEFFNLSRFLINRKKQDYASLWAMPVLLLRKQLVLEWVFSITSKVDQLCFGGNTHRFF